MKVVKYILASSLFISSWAYSQNDSRRLRLFNVPTFNALLNIQNPQDGNLAYQIEDGFIYQHNGTFWSRLGKSWQLEGNQNISSQDFIGSINPMRFDIGTNSKNRMTINTNGDVGIGTTPEYEFHIKTNRIIANENPTNGTISSNSSQGTQPPQLAIDNDNCTFWASNIAPTGNAPIWLRMDYGNSPRIITAYELQAGFTSNGLSFGPEDWVFQASNDASEWITLHNVQNVNTYGNVQFDFVNTLAYRYYRLLMYNKANPSINNVRIQELKLFEGQLSTDEVFDAFVFTDGKLGIGIEPTEKVHVNGNVLCLSIQTPDYVFENYYNNATKHNYEFMSLEEVESFVKQHKHLPNVPSAKDIKKQGGIVVNESAEKNLEKIEELFLYIIEMNEEVKKLERELEVLKRE